MAEFEEAAATTTAGPVQPIALGRVIDLGGGAALTVVAVHGEVLGYGPVDGAENDENDLSVGVLVQVGKFDYIMAGDLGGGESSADRNCTGRTTDQVDLESPLARSLVTGGGAPPLLSLAGVEALCVNHHGSESSTNVTWMNVLMPAVAVIQVGAGQGDYQHPRRDVVEQVLMAQAPCIVAPRALVLQSEEGWPIGPETSFAGHCVGDIVIWSDGRNSFHVTADGRVSEGPDERAETGLLFGPRFFLLDTDISSPDLHLVINEIMQHPAAVPDDVGEWFEFYNAGTNDVDISGWVIRDEGVDKHFIGNSGPFVIKAGGYLVLGRSGYSHENGGYVPDYVYSGFQLANDDDEIILETPWGRIVDAVSYTGLWPWPDPTGRSMELIDPARDNANGAGWGEAIARGGRYDPSPGDLGTPGAKNSIAR